MMEVNKTVSQDMVIDWEFTGQGFTEEDAWQVVDQDTQAMEEAGYVNTFEDEVWLQKDEEITMTISQIWTKDLDSA